MADPPDSRTRSFRWPDPAQFAEPIRKKSGLEFMRSFLTGDLPAPPFMELLDLRMVSVERGAVTFEFEPKEFMYSPLGNVHGGIVTVLLDSAMGCSFHTTLSAGVGYTTLELKVNFLRSVTSAAGPLRAEGKVIHGGSRIGTADARLLDRTGKLYAHASSTRMARPHRPSPAGAWLAVYLERTRRPNMCATAYISDNVFIEHADAEAGLCRPLGPDASAYRGATARGRALGGFPRLQPHGEPARGLPAPQDPPSARVRPCPRRGSEASLFPPPPAVP